ncbi:10751_t:CDS:2 [Funneliformis geosporum]|nr:10751_t:CDS:2 [Funneliformis geosporum]
MFSVYGGNIAQKCAQKYAQRYVQRYAQIRSLHNMNGNVVKESILSSFWSSFAIGSIGFAAFQLVGLMREELKEEINPLGTKVDKLDKKFDKLEKQFLEDMRQIKALLKKGPQK